jgi:hypothetical protein
LGGEEFFNPNIAESVQASISANAMTPSVAKEFVDDLETRRSVFLATVKQTQEGLSQLRVTGSSLQPGQSDLAFLIPRELFKNQVSSFAKELLFLSRLIAHFSEAVTGIVEPAELEQLSSSIPTVAIAANVGIVAAIAAVVNKFLEAWEKIEKIRKIRADLNEMGMKGKLVEELTTQITTTINEVIEESAEITLKGYGGDAGRRNELENALKQDTRRLFGQIERGLTIQFRAEPKEDADEKERIALKEVDRVSHVMQFPRIEFEPLLLTQGEVLEGDLPEVTVVSRKTTTKKTTTKEVRKGAKAEQESD